MPIDASIYGNLRPVEMPSYLDSAQRAMSLSQLAMKNRKEGQEIADSEAVRDAFAKNVGPDGSINRPGVFSDLAKTAPLQAMQYKSQFAEMDQKQADAQQKVMADKINQMGFASQLAMSAKDQPSYDGVIQTMQSMGLDTSHMPAQYDPQLMRSYAVASLQQKERLEAMAKSSEMDIAKTKAPLENAKIQAETDKLRSEKNGRPLAAEQTDKLAGHDASLKMIGDLRSAIAANKNDFGPVAGRLASANPYDQRGQAVSALFKKAAQTIGKSLEGGKLTDQDYVKYQKMLPSQTDTPAVANAKLDQLERMVASQQNSDLSSYSRAGLNVQNFSETTPPDIAVTHPKKGKANLIQSANAAPPPVKPGAEVDGYVFMGGDPSDQKSWKRAR